VSRPSRPRAMRSAPLALAVVLGLGLTACRQDEAAEFVPTPPMPAGTATSLPTAPLTPPPVGESARVTDVIDGDTVDVTQANGTTLRVRILGIDTPEVHKNAECGGQEASAYAERILMGMPVTLQTDPTQDLTDRYNRALRYVIVDGRSYSIMAADAGVARSYVFKVPVQQHPEIAAAEKRAQAAARGVWAASCVQNQQTPPPKQTKSPMPTAPPKSPVKPAPQPAKPAPQPGRGCEPGYSPCVPLYPPDVDCGDVNGPIRVTGPDPHRLDADHDGVGCES
jgi:endonuclease YncB( thermonuclease family)